MKTIIGVFNDPHDAEETLQDLKNEGFEPSDISVIMKDQHQAVDIKEGQSPQVGQSAMTGVKTGAAVGGLTGFLAGTIFPGLGLFLIGGPLAAALGLTGLAASTLSGVATGAVAGGLLGALMGLGLSEEQAQTFEKSLKEGAVLLAVPAMDMDENDVHEIFVTHHAEDITVIGAPSIPATPSGYEYFEEDVSPQHPVYARVGTKGGKAKSTAKKPKSNRSRHPKKSVK